jgi:peptidoglycan/xylan/chitin deacetylase (PgdA/CDA1 family)
MMLALVAGAVAAVLVLGRAGAHAARVARTGGHAHHRLHHLHPRPTPAQLAALTVVRENAAINGLLGRQPFISAGGGTRREIALTFDDGPGPYTPKILGELKRLHAPATFFEIGFMFRWFRGAAVQAMRMGDPIGDHTETHPRMALLSPAAQRAQVLDQTQWLRKIEAPFPRLWRPPYGSYNAATLKILAQLHMIMVLWTVDTDDYLRPGVGVIVRRTLAGARPGAIILLHDGGGDRSQTAAALPLIVHALRKRGYVLVTVPRLILDDPPIGHQVLPAHLAGG